MAGGRAATVVFTLPGGANANHPTDLQVHDLQGRVVRRLVIGSRPTGTHTVYWDGRDAEGRPLATGLYVLHLHSGGRVANQRVLLVR